MSYWRNKADNSWEIFNCVNPRCFFWREQYKKIRMLHLHWNDTFPGKGHVEEGSAAVSSSWEDSHSSANQCVTSLLMCFSLLCFQGGSTCRGIFVRMCEWVWLTYVDSLQRGCILFIYSAAVVQMLLWNRVRESPTWQNGEVCPQFNYWHSVGCSMNVENTCCSKWRGFGFPSSSY